jgi:hypothetical protein
LTFSCLDLSVHSMQVIPELACTIMLIHKDMC